MRNKIAVLLFVIVLIFSSSAISFATEFERDLSLENEYAQELKSLGLFYGVTDTDFDLDRAPTRVEAMIMLIRTLGEEETARNGQWEHPFTDVPSWADAYIGYAYQNGLTSGISATKFGTGDADAAMYVTFTLRALGYSDGAEKDFTWDNPFELAEDTGILPATVDKKNFLRGDAVAVSHAALDSKLKDSDQALSEKLIDKGAFTKEAFSASYMPSSLNTFKVEKLEDGTLKVNVYGSIETDSNYLIGCGHKDSFNLHDIAGSSIKDGYFVWDDVEAMESPDSKFMLMCVPNEFDVLEFSSYTNWGNSVKLDEVGKLDTGFREVLKRRSTVYAGIKGGEKVHFKNDKAFEIVPLGDYKYRIHVEGRPLVLEEIHSVSFHFTYYEYDPNGYRKHTLMFDCGGKSSMQKQIGEGDFLIDITKIVGSTPEDWAKDVEAIENDGEYLYTITYKNDGKAIYEGTI